MSKDKITIRGAREHNLKDVNLELPRDKLIVITGISGSGKSSLAFDTIYAEGQRRYIESLSSYARMFLGQMDKPDVDYIDGLSPAISIQQRTTLKNPRSTVATVTEIHDYLRLLYARLGKPYCYKCGREISKQSLDQIVDAVLRLPEGTKIYVMAPLVKGQKGSYKDLLEELHKEGYSRVRIDGHICELRDIGMIKLEKNKKHTIELLVDRLVISQDIRKRLADSIQACLEKTKGKVLINYILGEGESQEMLFSENMGCPECGISMDELSPRMFSFNNPQGACRECSGLGVMMHIDPDLVIPDKNKSVFDGAIVPWNDPIGKYYTQMLEGAAREYGFDLYTPIKELTKEQLDVILYGTGNRLVKVELESWDGNTHLERMQIFEGVINNLERRFRETKSESMREWMMQFMSQSVCPSCNGERLRPESRAVRVGEKSITEVVKMSILQAYEFFSNMKLSEREEFIAKQILKEIKERLRFLIDVGLEYLTLDRSASTLSGGEAQRIQLATQIGSSLVGVLYILDEPSIGLHQRDNKRLISTLKHLRDIGNTVIVVEHDDETILSSDYVVDMGPGAGVHGGKVVSQGSPEDVMKDTNSLTGDYLSGRRYIPLPSKRRKGNGKALVVKGARENNLKNIDVRIPLGLFTCITGVSGSGKSTLVDEILHKGLGKLLYGSNVRPGAHDSIEGVEYLDKAIIIDQSPIGRTPRSNSATYTGVFTPIRELFARTPEARARGYKSGRFSFNVKGGRCESCEGDGIIKLEMHFLPDVYVPCEVCKGERYNKETLEIIYKGKNISEVLNMTVDESLEFFANIPQIKNKLQTIKDVGLGYIKLGQPATTLSGGEAQRVKLATELSKRATGRTLYMLDEPTTGLHFADIQKLLDVLCRLVDAGNTVVVIEHNLDVIKTADHIIDLGPEGGDAGGEIVAEGTPEEVAKNPRSYTGMFLKEIIARDVQRMETRKRVSEGKKSGSAEIVA